MQHTRGPPGSQELRPGGAGPPLRPPVAPLPPVAPPPHARAQAYIYTCLLGYSMSFIIFGSQVSILGPTIKPLAARLHVDEPDLSPLFTSLGISCIISGTPSGWLVDRVATHYVLVGSLLIEVRACMRACERSAPWHVRAAARRTQAMAPVRGHACWCGCLMHAGARPAGRRGWGAHAWCSRMQY